MKSSRSGKRRGDVWPHSIPTVNEEAESAATFDWIAESSKNLLPIRCKYTTTTAFIVILIYIQQVQVTVSKGSEWKKESTQGVDKANSVCGQYKFSTVKRRRSMASQEVEEMVVHLEQTLDLSPMEHRVRLVGAALVGRKLNKWGIRNILRSVWKEFGEVDIKWVRDNTFVITVQDECVASKILAQVP